MRHPESQRFWQINPEPGMGLTTPPGATPGANYTPTQDLVETFSETKDPEEMKEAYKQLLQRQTAKVAPKTTDEMIANDREMVMTTAGPMPRKQANATQGMSIMLRPENEAQLKAQQAAAAAKEPGFVGQKYMTMGGRPAKFSRADIAREKAMAVRRRGQAMGFAGVRDKLNRDMQQQTFSWMAEAAGEQAAAGIAASNAKVEYEAAAKSVDRGRKQLDALKIDPDRYWRNMPSSQKTLMRIGLFFGGLAEGLSGGRLKSAAMTMLMAAQGRDMDAQKQNMRKLLTSVQMDSKDRDRLMTRFDAQEKRREVSGLRVMQLQLSRMGLKETRLGHKEKYAELVNAIDQRVLDVLRQSRGGGGRRVPTFEYKLHKETQARKDVMSHGAMLKAGTGKAAAGRGKQALEEAEEILPDMEKRYYAMPKSALLGKLDWTGELQDYERIRKRLSVALWRMFDSGKLSDKDMDVAMDSFLPAGKWGTIPKYRAAYGKAFTSLKTFLSGARKRMERGAAYSTPAQAKAAMRVKWLAKGLSTKDTD